MSIRRALLVVLAAAPFLSAAAACGGEKTPPPRLPAEDTTVAMAGPTVVVAWRRLSQAEVDTDEDLALLLFDFERYAANAAPALQAAGLTVHQVGAKRVRLSDGGRQVADLPSVEPRYILAAPGRAPRVLEGLQTDADLLRAAADYFQRPELDRSAD